MNFHAETRLGAYAAAEAFVHLYLRDGRRYQVQLPPRGAALRQLQLLHGRLQLPDGDFLFELSYERGGLHSCHPKRSAFQPTAGRISLASFASLASCSTSQMLQGTAAAGTVLLPRTLAFPGRM